MRKRARRAHAPFIRGRKLSSLLAPVLLALVLAALFVGCAFQSAQAQTASSAPFSFRAGQRMYIVAYRRIRPYLPVTDASIGDDIHALPRAKAEGSGRRGLRLSRLESAADKQRS